MQKYNVGRPGFTVGLDFGSGAPAHKIVNIHVNLFGDILTRESFIALINMINVLGVAKGKLSWE